MSSGTSYAVGPRRRGEGRSGTFRVSRRESTVLVQIVGHLGTDSLAGLRHALADLIDGQGNTVVTVELDSGDRAVTPVLAALLVEAAGWAARHRGHLIISQRAGEAAAVPTNR
jgi:hypothetical protein